MEIKELLAGLQEHKDAREVQEYIAKSITSDIAKGFLSSPDGEKLINSGTVSAVESRVTSALKTQQVKAQAELDVERKGKMTLEEQVSQITKHLEDSKRAQELSEKRARITKLAAEKNVPQDFLNILDLSKQDDEITAFIESEAKRQELLVKKGTDEARSGSVKPGSGTSPVSAPDVSKMSSQERLDYYIREREKRITNV